MKRLIDKLSFLPKSYFTLNDLRKIAEVNDNVLKVTLNRLVKQGKIFRLSRGYYAVDLDKLDWEEFTLGFYRPSYFSFEWALNYYGILSQQSYALTLATVRRGKTINIHNRLIVYHHLHPKYFWGFIRKGNLLIAEPEKAFLDQIYLFLNGNASWDKQEVDMSFLNKKKLKRYLKKFNNKRLNSYLQKFF